MVIQMLLREAGRDVDQDLVAVEPDGLEAAGRLGEPAIAGDLPRLRAGAELRVPGGAVPDEPRDVRRARRAAAQPVGAAGDWAIERWAGVLNEPAGASRSVPRARPPPRDGPARAGRVRAVPGAPRRRAARDAHGVDVDEEGNGTADDQRLYQLIRQPGAIGDRTFEIEFLDAGVEAFVFTFG